MIGQKIGFTGNRGGMTDAQKETFRKFVGATFIGEFHHGLCIGSDAEAHDIVAGTSWECRIIGHPPINQEFRADRICDELRAPLPYLIRNRNIVNSTSRLLATPSGPEKLRSGTWSTIRYAKRRGVPVLIIMPDGSTIREE